MQINVQFLNNVCKLQMFAMLESSMLPLLDSLFNGELQGSSILTALRTLKPKTLGVLNPIVLWKLLPDLLQCNCVCGVVVTLQILVLMSMPF